MFPDDNPRANPQADPRRSQTAGDPRPRADAAASDAEAVRVAVGVVLRRGRSGPWLLIGHRFADAHLPDLWEFPGGKALPGESGAACAVREVEEETGLRVAPLRLLLERPYAYPDRMLHLEFHLCEYVGGDPEPLGCRAVRWTRPDHLDIYPFPGANGPILDALGDAARG